MVVMSQRNEQASDNEETRLAQAADTLSQLPRKPRSRRAQVEYLHAFILMRSTKAIPMVNYHRS
jgi:uncharacterized Zn finger protein